MKQQGIFTLDWGSIADAAIMAAIMAVAVVLYGIVTAAGFNVFAADWASIGKGVVNAGIIAFVISLAQGFISTKSGSVLGITPPNTLN